MKSKIVVGSYNNEQHGSPKHRVENVISRFTNEVMLVDWLDSKFPKTLPCDFQLSKNNDTEKARRFLESTDNLFVFFHQLWGTWTLLEGCSRM